ncbi:MAG: glycoside hydrolase family 43 protein [Bacteroidaceae bacterium]|nr:glycoside hydrolase family 43 protein [Bacteroidaceae bacterium]MBO4593884.1 glycoside hydrolase family 43 protein [Bacteroidaceae bacterium]MBR4782328.1 glycoside hydrolase family 43 protein [Bacteroidaceae bacterium]
MKIQYLIISLALSMFTLTGSAQKKGKYSGNPVFSGWYADPEGAVFGKEYWIYPTYSVAFHLQLHMDAFSSKDLSNWQKHERVLSTDGISWLKGALWAPSITEKDGKYYLFFGANNIQNNEQLGGIGVAVADNPAGPFKDAIGHPLVDKIVNNAQPIDQHVFRDDDGQYYMYYGGWGHCNVVKLNSDLTSLGKFSDGTTFKEITPEGYVEGPFMLKRNGKYYFMWSEGAFTGPDYRVAYAVSDNPIGPFKREAVILQQDPEVGTGAGHHSVIKGKGKNEYYIVYHRHPLDNNDGNARETCIDRLRFTKDGKIIPVKLTKQGVKRRKL